MSVFPISGPGLALGTSSSKKRSVGAERRAAPRVVPSRCPGRAGAVGGPPDPVPANGAAPLLSARSVGLRYVTHENRVLRAGGQESNPSQSNPPQRTGDPRSATSPERVSELATLPYLRPELGGWLRAVPGACSTGSVSGSGRAPAAATAVPGGRLGMLRAGALPGAAPPARWARASPPLSI